MSTMLLSGQDHGMPRSALLACTFVVALAAGCPPEEPPCEENIVGDADAPVELQVVHRTAQGELFEAEPAGDVELFRPPQGGKVFLTAARVRNVDACGLRIQASLHDKETQRVLGLEGRPFAVRETADGWLEPLSASSLSSWANVPACPTQAVNERVDGNVYELRVQVEDRAGRKGEARIDVVPRCVQPAFLGEQCRCECSADYSLGETCEEPDGGTADGGATTDGGADLDAGASLDAAEGT
jgi:hypothetical protein